MNNDPQHHHIEAARSAERALQPMGEILADVFATAAKGVADVTVERARQELLLKQHARANGEAFVSDAELMDLRTEVVEAEERRRQMFPPTPGS